MTFVHLRNPSGARPRNPFSASRHRFSQGYSLVEMLVTLFIIAILAAILFDLSWNRIRMKTERIKCESNLTTLYVGFKNYMAEYGSWPQVSEDLQEFGSGANDDKMAEFWIETMRPYIDNEKHWMCPTDLRELQANTKKEDRDKYEMSYVPTPFDSGPNTPNQWRQPWLMERGTFHGEGPLGLYPDGSIQMIYLPPGF